MSKRSNPIEPSIDDEAKRPTSPTGDDKPTLPLLQVDVLAKEARREPVLPIEELRPPPIQTISMPRERAHMLATLPRSRLSDMFWPAITGLAGCAPGTLDAIEQALKFTQKVGDQNQIYYGVNMYGIINVIITAVFLTLFIVSVVASLKVKTSTRYLRELYDHEEVGEPMRLRVARFLLRC